MFTSSVCMGVCISFIYSSQHLKWTKVCVCVCVCVCVSLLLQIIILKCFICTKKNICN